MKKKGIILALVLWVLFFLSVTALTVSLKNRMNIRLRSYRNEEQRMFYLAKEALNRAVAVLMDDNPDFDSLNDEWGKDFSLQSGDGLLSYEVIDEDRFLNVNTAAEELLNNMQLLYPELTKEIIAEIIKNRPFNLKNEVMDAAGVDAKVFFPDAPAKKSAMEELITVFSDAKININTSPEEILALIPAMNQTAIDSILARRSSAAFESNDRLSQELSLLGLSAVQVNNAVKYLKVNSSVFRIKAKAVSSRKNIKKDLEIVVSREKDKCSVLLFKEN